MTVDWYKRRLFKLNKKLCHSNITDIKTLVEYIQRPGYMLIKYKLPNSKKIKKLYRDYLRYILNISSIICSMYILDDIKYLFINQLKFYIEIINLYIKEFNFISTRLI